MKSLNNTGYSKMSSLVEFDKLMDEHAENYKGALEHLYDAEDKVKALILD